VTETRKQRIKAAASRPHAVISSRTTCVQSSGFLGGGAANQLPAVFDGVLSPRCLMDLTAPAFYDVGPDIYRRSQGSCSPQEVFIESLLVGLGCGSTREVEWWGRSEWKPVEAHRDVDEEAAVARGDRRCPTNSLIVYLDVVPGMRAPTCLWVPDDDTGHTSALLVVPAVPGRVLIFPGTLLHAVPCPTLSWLGPEAKPELAGDRPLDRHCGGTRRVLVLNLWDDHAPVDEEREEWEEWEEQEEQEEQEGDEEVEVVEFEASRVECEPRDRWRPVALQAADESSDCRETASWPTLLTHAHGTDEQLASTVRAARAVVADTLESERAPRWLWTNADVSNPDLGVPSLAGAREERGEPVRGLSPDEVWGAASEKGSEAQARIEKPTH
jgi:hypothetical protein